MFLSQLVDKEILVGNTVRGVVKGVGVSLKTYNVKYLLCVGTSTSRAPFAISVNAITDMGERVVLSRLRPLLPKHCACVFLRLPVYSFEGEFLGELEDLTMQDFIATTLSTDKNYILPISVVAACTDALLLKKEQPYPLGQRIPAPAISIITEKTDGVVTRPILRAAMQKSALIKLTLSLPPFYIDKL